MKILLLLVAFLALSGCCAPRPATWPPRPEWDRLDPSMCHPQPWCEACPGRAEWPGRVVEPPHAR